MSGRGGRRNPPNQGAYKTGHEKYQGGPVGVNTLAAALAEEPEAIEEIYEPFLIQIGFLNRTPRGRCVTRAAYKHMGFAPPKMQQELIAS